MNKVFLITLFIVMYGVASYYAHSFQGKTMANGEVFDMYKLTAAHLTFPFGTKVKVTNIKNGKSINVVIADRGPYIKGRCIDLSFMAAYHLGMLYDGIVPVKIEVVK